MIYDEQAKERRSSGRSDFGMYTVSVRKSVCTIAPIECYSGQRYFQEKKKNVPMIVVFSNMLSHI